jgi:hypothetical protein
MNIIGKFQWLLVVLGLATLAVPGFAAPSKTYSLKAASGAAYAPDSNGQQVLQVPLPIVITVKNESPPSVANSNISSFSFTVSGMTIESVDTTSCNTQGGQCSLDTVTNTVSVTNISPPVQGQGTFSVPVKVSSCGDGSWSAKVFSGSQLNGNTFGFQNDSTLPTNLATSVTCGDTKCGMGFVVPSDLAVSGNPTYVNGIRGDFNKDGSTCSVLDYTVTNTIPTNDKLHFEWNASSTSAAFLYTLNFVTATTTPQLAWLTDSSGPVFVDAQPCLSTNMPNNLPAPYGTLAQDVNSSKNKIQVNVTSAPTIPVPFPIVIGTERMLVTNTGTNNWSVQRGQGGTHPAPHSATARIMSTPLPLLTGPFTTAQNHAGYIVGYQAQMCITSPNPTSWPSLTYDIIDIGDGWGLGK